MPHSFGVRARTRHMFAKKFRQHGLPTLSQYQMPIKIGDYVDIFANPSIHKGMPHKHYHGRTGIVFNVTKSAVGVRVNKPVNGRIIEKRIHVRIEHIRKSKCQTEILARKVANEEAKAVMLSVWDQKKQESLRIDLWTKDMPVDEMKLFFHQTLVTMSDMIS